jgi:excinuclease UvrABC nuclease subunit
MWSTWAVVEFHRAFAGSVPNSPGIYALIRAHRVQGIPLTAEPVYIGKSRNLRNRFAQHADPMRQHNSDLGAVTIRENLEFWYLPLPEEGIDEAERAAIQALAPQTNKIRYNKREGTTNDIATR